MLIFTDVAAVGWKDELLYTSLLGAVMGAVGLAIPRVGIYLLILTALGVSATAIALQGTMCAAPGDSILHTRVLSAGGDMSTIEVAPPPFEKNLEEEGQVLQVSGRDLLVRAQLYRRSAWFFLSRGEILYGDMRLETAPATAEGEDWVSLPPKMFSLQKQLLQWAVRLGALHTRTVSAVQREVQVLSTYLLTVEDEGIEWRKHVQ